MSDHARPKVEIPDIDEKGAVVDGQPQSSSKRLFMQFLAFGGCSDREALVESVKGAGLNSVLYADANDPFGVGMLTYHHDPNYFLDHVHAYIQRSPFADLNLKDEFTMTGRTYSLGYEPDLQEALFDRPRRHVLQKDWPWVVWYPLRRGGKFEQLSPEEKCKVLMEHGKIGMSYGAGDYAHDVRLACHGLDKHDNDFVIGLVGKDLYPLSKVVQTMRGTQQTSLYLTSLGPFFVGRVLYQAEM